MINPDTNNTDSSNSGSNDLMILEQDYEKKH